MRALTREAGKTVTRWMMWCVATALWSALTLQVLGSVNCLSFFEVLVVFDADLFEFVDVFDFFGKFLNDVGVWLSPNHVCIHCKLNGKFPTCRLERS